MTKEEAKEWSKILAMYAGGQRIENVDMETVEIVQDYYLEGFERVVTDYKYDKNRNGLY